MNEQLLLGLVGNSHRDIVYDFLDRAEAASLPGLSLDYTVAEHQDRWHRLTGIADDVLAGQRERKRVLTAQAKIAASPAARRHLQRDLRQIEDAERDLRLVVENLWQVAHEELEADAESRHGLICDDEDDDASEWFWNTLSCDRAREAFGSLTLHELARLARREQD